MQKNNEDCRFIPFGGSVYQDDKITFNIQVLEESNISIILEEDDVKPSLIFEKTMMKPGNIYHKTFNIIASEKPQNILINYSTKENTNNLLKFIYYTKNY